MVADDAGIAGSNSESGMTVWGIVVGGLHGRGAPIEGVNLLPHRDGNSMPESCNSEQQFDSSRARRVLEAVAPGSRLVSVTPAKAAFTNAVDVFDTISPDGQRARFVVKRMTDEPDPERAAADFHGLQIARRHGIPAPEPVFLDATGELLGVPGIVTRFIRGRQIANPEDPAKWARDLADLLIRIHDVSPDADERRGIYDGNELGLYFLTGDWPEKMSGHPLSDTIYDAVRELRFGLREVPPVFLHMDYWPGNVLWVDGRVSAVLDWDAAGYGDPALDVGYFRMNMYLRGIKAAADVFLEHYEAARGQVVNLGFWELACAARPLPDPAAHISFSRQMGDFGATDDRAETDYYEFVEEAMGRAREGR